MNFILARLRERSTYNGIAAFVAGLVFVPHASEYAALIPSLGLVISGLINIVTPDVAPPK